ncbi:aminotransferase class III-fold pyridoxal phosphate-dependent enzyme [Aeromicrobium phragmitis]|uniref:Aminotransferase class III-fold pyridoxal phosphate-dependent enzyme n=1 Tax=Aeromicrobium phragmitis TaxID=2478914 RepID=A0A3L8PR47_9ACTN|nr:aminotransferase class III-fold pyridoxal phosphate-dependent enzyme [Aeromicrobium phragmitis]RLV57103.1 aminotransferase class III-fold pyridoxal phosphate-dependent enzyme [Aeromicrobium phragmitis]
MSQPNDDHPTWTRARAVVPRGVSSGHRVGWKQVFVRTEGAYVWDDEGSRYLDYLNAWGPIVLGHSDERVNRAVYEAVSTCDLTGVGPQRGEAELAEKICEVMPSAEKVAFCTSGTDATMHAVHVARAATGRLKVLKFHGSYHGWNDHVAVGSSRKDLNANSILNTPNGGGLHPAVVDDVVVVEWNDRAGLEAAFTTYGEELAIAFAEPYIHSFGCIPAQPGFLELLRELCTRHGVVLTFDEVKTGFRAAIGGYQSLCGVTPDLTAFGKAVANGYSLAGLAGSNALMGHLGAYDRDQATIDGTYNASPYSLAAANTTLRIMETENVHQRLWDLGARLRQGIAKAIDDTGARATVDGLGSEWCVYFRGELPTNFREAMQSDADAYGRYHASLLSQGILEPAFPTGDRRLNAATTDDDVDRSIEAVHTALLAAQT